MYTIYTMKNGDNKMKITKCELYNYNTKLVEKTDTIEKMNEFIQNDGSNYELMNIGSFDDKNFVDIRIDFYSGLALFITVEK